MASGSRTSLWATLKVHDALSTRPARQVMDGPAMRLTATTPASVYTSALLALKLAATPFR